MFLLEDIIKSVWHPCNIEKWKYLLDDEENCFIIL
jgi:hypothetical protein